MRDLRMPRVGLGTRLVIAFMLIVTLALVMAAGVFVVLQRDELERRVINGVNDAAPGILGRLQSLDEGAWDNPGDVTALIVAQSQEFGVRILTVDSGGAVVQDSENVLRGTVLIPLQVEGGLTSITNSPPEEFLETGFLISSESDEDLVVTGTWPIFRGVGAVDRISLGGASGLPDGVSAEISITPFDIEFPERLVLVVPAKVVSRAWMAALPGLGIAAALVIPIAMLLALFISRYITRPLAELTVAAQRVSDGDFSVRVTEDRSDEIGMLAQSFSRMVSRVGTANVQMRSLIEDISHDLKTPLTPILGFGKALRDDIEDLETARHAGAVIYEEAERLNSRLAELLYLSQLESGPGTLELCDVNVSNLIEETVRRLELQFQHPCSQSVVDVEPNVHVMVDGAKLERVVENLLTNAFRHSPANTPILVRLTSDASRGDMRFTLTNQAPDLIPSEIPRLFDRFYRSHTAGHPEGNKTGRGLGLPIARGLIDMQGGKLTARKTADALSFVVELPNLVIPT